MTRWLAVLALLACIGGSAPTALRWVRVAQREHYLAGAVSRFAWRWWTSGPLEVAMAIVALAGAAASTFEPWAAIVTGALVAVGPRRLGVRGRTSKLRWTRRCRTVGAALGLAGAVALAGAALGAGLRGAVVCAAFVLVFLPLALDAVLGALAPIEERLAARFVEEAAARVARVAPDVVAVTGSYGKTTTKGYVAHLLAGRFTVVASPRSFNNRAGLARTVNELLVPGTDVLVAEMGAYGPGEIAALCRWLVPKVAIITAVGPVHLERFKSLDRTLAAKSEITDRAETSVLNVDDDRLAGLAERLRSAGQAVVRCSAIDAGADVAVLEAQDGLALYRSGVLQGTAVTADGAPPGARSNVACAAGAALSLGCDPAEVLERLGTLPVASHRLEATSAASGALVLDDTFNANPAGAALALAALAVRGEQGRRVLVTPGMVELGSQQEQENAAFASAAAAVVAEAIVVGRTNRRALGKGFAVARLSGHDVSVRYVDDRDEAVAIVRRELGTGDVVLYENDLPDHFP